MFGGLSNRTNADFGAFYDRMRSLPLSRILISVLNSLCRKVAGKFLATRYVTDYYH